MASRVSPSTAEKPALNEGQASAGVAKRKELVDPCRPQQNKHQTAKPKYRSIQLLEITTVGTSKQKLARPLADIGRLCF